MNAVAVSPGSRALLEGIRDGRFPPPATAELLHRGRTLAHAEAVLTDGSGRRLVHATATLMIVRPD